ncbi:hypothetical protein FOA52_007585 [Chlamydomonas sp. UWO 241]|nr:hypothetical protein FOA52_007585 [Chlamydomonas sp. UWO 241]
MLPFVSTAQPGVDDGSTQKVLALLDLALPAATTTSVHLLEAIAKSCQLLQAVAQCKTSLAYNVLASSKPTVQSYAKHFRELYKPKHGKPGEFVTLHNSTNMFRDVENRLEKWFGTPKHDEIAGAGSMLSQEHLFMQIVDHLASLEFELQPDPHMGAAGTAAPRKHTWVVVLGTLPTKTGDNSTAALRNLKGSIATASNACVLWVECVPALHGAMAAARARVTGKPPAGQAGNASSDEPVDPRTADQYAAFARSLCSLRDASRPSRGGLPPIRGVAMLSLRELLSRDTGAPRALWDVMLETPITSDAQLDTMQGTRSKAFADVWADEGEALNQVFLAVCF